MVLSGMNDYLHPLRWEDVKPAPLFRHWLQQLWSCKTRDEWKLSWNSCFFNWVLAAWAGGFVRRECVSALYSRSWSYLAVLCSHTLHGVPDRPSLTSLFNGLRRVGSSFGPFWWPHDGYLLICVFGLLTEVGLIYLCSIHWATSDRLHHWPVTWSESALTLID